MTGNKWPMVKLGDVAPAKPIKPKDVASDSLVWQLTLDHIESQSGKLLKKNIQAYNEAGSSVHWFDDRHVLYSKLRPYLNKVILPDQMGLGTTELVPMQPDLERLDRRYLAYYLRSKPFVDWISAQVAGAKMPRVSMKVFWDHEIPLPPLEEQKRIAAMLDKADAIRRKRQQAIELADEFLRSVFLDMFGDPVTNPKGWDEYQLGQLLHSIDSGSSPKCDSRPANENEWAVLKLGSITSCSFIPEENKAMLQETAPREDFEVKQGDLLFARKNTKNLVAAVALVGTCPRKLLMPDLIFRLNTKDELVNKVFLWAMMTHSGKRAQIQNLASGAAGSMPNISKANLKTVLIPLPPLDKQEEFSDLYNAILKIKVRSASEFKQSLNLFSGSLSQKAFAGEL